MGYCHAVAHSLGGLYNTPHGLANSVILPYVLRAYGSSVFRPLKELAVAVGLAEETMPESLAAESFRRALMGDPGLTVTYIQALELPDAVRLGLVRHRLAQRRRTPTVHGAA